MRKRFRKVERACARLEGWGRPGCGALMLRDASQRSRICAGICVRARCDAPQHEDGAHFGQTTPPAAVGADRRPRSIVSGLLFTM